jgi:hypothetical protein
VVVALTATDTRALAGVSEDLRRQMRALLTNEHDILRRYPLPAPDEKRLFADTDLVITMATRYNLETDEGRFRFVLAQRTLLLLMLIMTYGKNYHVVVADSSPQHGIVRAVFEAIFAELGHGITVLDAREWNGIGPQNQLALAHAYVRGAKRALKIDPEKYGLADVEVLESIVRRIQDDLSDILAIGRSPNQEGTGFRSLPRYQQETERRMSRALVELGLPEDGASGIWAFNRTGMLAWLAFDTDTYGNMWQILWHAQLQALVARLRLDVLFLKFVHPIEMVRYEEGDLERDPARAEEIAAFYRDKRDQQAALVSQVVAYAATLGIYPQHDPDHRWMI